MKAVDHVTSPLDLRANACHWGLVIERDRGERIGEEDFFGEKVTHLVVQGVSRRATTRFHGACTTLADFIVRCWRICECRLRHYLTFL